MWCDAVIIPNDGAGKAGVDVYAGSGDLQDTAMPDDRSDTDDCGWHSEQICKPDSSNSDHWPLRGTGSEFGGKRLAAESSTQVLQSRAMNGVNPQPTHHDVPLFNNASLDAVSYIPPHTFQTSK